MGREEKSLFWLGSSLDDVRAFPEAARRAAGHELHQIQKGLSPSDWRPMPGVGAGAREIRISTGARGGRVEHRVFYVAKFEEAVWVLHAFQKTTRKTSRRDIELGRRRYASMVRERSRRRGTSEGRGA